MTINAYFRLLRGLQLLSIGIVLTACPAEAQLGDALFGYGSDSDLGQCIQRVGLDHEQLVLVRLGEAAPEVIAGPLRRTAVEGDADQQYCAGLLLDILAKSLDRYGNSEDHKDEVARLREEAVKWFRKAADRNHAEATNELASAFLRGVGVQKSEDEFYRLRALAAARGSSDAQLSMAKRHLSGEGGLEIDTDKALEFLRLAANNGSGEAMYWLGDFLNDGEYGHGGSWATIRPSPQAAALVWTRCAVECQPQWAVYSQLDLAKLYQSGHGVLQDFSAAARWYGFAAELGDREAQYRLGRLLAAGRGTPKDLVQAHTWLNLAAELPTSYSDEARAIRDMLADSMSSTELNEAHRRAREWSEDYVSRSLDERFGILVPQLERARFGR